MRIVIQFNYIVILKFSYKKTPIGIVSSVGVVIIMWGSGWRLSRIF